MAYTILSFDGLQLPVLRRRSAEQNMGTGSAQTEFRQLPGGGFYRMRRNQRSPQGIQPVTASRVITGASATSMRQQLDAWRSKIGVYGKLSVRFRDGSLRWQWAELQSVSTPQSPSNNVGGQIQDIELVWQTAAQHWNGIIRGPAWVWGDNSWVFGDGTASFGQNDLSYQIGGVTSYAFDATNAGNIDTTNLLVTHTVAGSRTNWALRNAATGQEIRYTGTLTTGQSIRIDTAAQRAQRLGPLVNVSEITRALNTLTIVTSGAHGLSVGNSVEISGMKYAGLYTVASVVDFDIFTAAVSPDVYAYGFADGGTARQLTDIYANLTLTDEQRWMVLRPGVNNLTVSSGSAMTGDVVQLEYWDAYA